MKIGKRRNKIAFIRLAETQNVFGEVIKGEQDIAFAWAAIEPVSGNERFLSNTTLAQANVKIRSRYVAGITPKDIIGFGTRRYDIISVSNIDEKNKELVVFAKERV
jgi:SPP1 family predicted phage head-tail adaptor